jgi:activating signal cointegrator complex subunit 2
MLGLIREDLQWLLRQSYAQFWCQMVWDESLQGLIDSYIQNAPRTHDGTADILNDSSPLGELEKDLYRLVFMVLLRTATHRESKKEFMEGETFGGIIYENWLFDIPKLFDIVAVYGGGNKSLVAKMVGNIFRHQASYHDDLVLNLEGVRGVLDLAAQRCANSKPMAPNEVLDLQRYTVDICATLHAFLEVCPAEAMDAFVTDGTLLQLGKFYEAVIPSLTTFWGRAEQVDGASRGGPDGLMDAQLWLTLLSHQLLEHCHGRGGQPTDGKESAILNVLDQLYDLEHFLADWTMQRPLVDALKLIAAQPGIDRDRIQYAITVTERLAQDAAEVVEGGSGGGSSGEGSETGGGAGAGAAVDTSTNDVAVQQILEMFPHLGLGYIDACLDAFNNNPETAINKLFDNALPPDVKALPEDLPREPVTAPTPLAASGKGNNGRGKGKAKGKASFQPQASSAAFVPGGGGKDALTDRHNVFDGDEFDVFSGKAIDMSRVHQGKRHTEAKLFLEDKKSVTSNLKFFQDMQYEDEYDDTYDEPGGRLVAHEDDDLVPNVNHTGREKKVGEGDGLTERQRVAAREASAQSVAKAARKEGRKHGVFVDAGGVGGGGGGPKRPPPGVAGEQRQDYEFTYRQQRPAADQTAEVEVRGGGGAGDAGGAGGAGGAAHARGGGGGTSGQVCFDFKRGACRWGDDCRFSHADPDPEGKFGPDKGKGGRVYGGGGGKPKAKVDLAEKSESSLRARAKKDKNKAANANHNRKKANDKKNVGGVF